MESNKLMCTSPYSSQVYMVISLLFLLLSLLVYFNVRIDQLTMAETRSIYKIVFFFALHWSAKGFELMGHDGKKIKQLFKQEQCLTILATDVETYDGI